MEKTEEKKGDDILFVNFNQSRDCFAVGTQTGFKIYNTCPFKETHSRDLGGGIGHVEMLFRSNIVGLVGGGDNPRYPSQKVMLWDDNQGKCVGELCFRTEVKAVKMKSDKLVVVLETKFFIYNFADLKLIDHQETCPNILGLCSLNQEGSETILAYLDKTPGGVIVNNYNTKEMVRINAHQSPLRCLELSPNGKILASASEKGTLIRVFNTDKGETLCELRRGSEYANIYSIAFDPTASWIACASDSGTIHIFHINKGEEAKNPKSKLSILSFMSSYFNSEWSFAQYRINDTRESKIAFHPDSNSIVILTIDGNFYHISFDPANGGECLLRCQDKILTNGESAPIDNVPK